MITDQEFAAAYNDLEAYQTVAQVAAALGINERTVRTRAFNIRMKSHNTPDSIQLISRAVSPQSEQEYKFREEWTQEDCIEELKRVQALDPEKHITRNLFRHAAKCSDATWSRYFGTFLEFRRRAGLELNRQQHKLERHIAQHASVDHLRLFNNERRDYADKYIRVSREKFKTVLACSDLHDIECDPFYLRVLIDTAKRVQPDVIAITGDLFDLAEFSKYTVDPREWDVVGRIRWAHDNILGPLRQACPHAQIDLIEGNHEARLLLMLANATPALRAVLSDLHGFTLAKLFGLDQFEINYVAKADLATFTARELEKEVKANYKVYFDCFLAHHFPHARNMGLPGWNGHHHSHVVWQQFNMIHGTYEWHQLGSGHKRAASYTEGEKWGNGFLLANCNTETRSTVMDYVSVGRDFAISGGKFYYREEVEQIPQIKIAA